MISMSISRVVKNHLKCDCIDGTFVNGGRGPILFGFILPKSPADKMEK